jgi:hypothetical protein
LEIPTAGKKVVTKGMLMDSYLAEKLKKVVEANPRLSVSF